MTIYLVDMAIMPEGCGSYISRMISTEHFIREVQTSHEAGNLQAYIGYLETTRILSEATGINFTTNRREAIFNSKSCFVNRPSKLLISWKETKAKLKNGDTILVILIAYRVKTRLKKNSSSALRLDDFEFRRVTFVAEGELPF